MEEESHLREKVTRQRTIIGRYRTINDTRQRDHHKKTKRSSSAQSRPGCEGKGESHGSRKKEKKKGSLVEVGH